MLGRTALTLAMAFIGAELVYNLASARRRTFWRVLFTIPMVIPVTVNLMIWQQVYAGRQGLLNEFLVGIGAMARAYPWLGRPNSALLALVFIGFPAIAGFGFLVILDALQNLSAEVKDAALIAILSMNSGMQEFSSMFVLTQGGPANATMSPAFNLYQQGFTYGEQGYATAIGTVLMLMTLVFSIVILRIRYRRAHDVAV